VDEPQAIATGKGRGFDGVAAIAVAAAATAAAIAWSYYPCLTYLARWWEDPNYSHGWLIAPIALFILWQRREMLPAIAIRHRWWNFPPLALLLAWRYWLYEANDQWLEAATVPAVIAAATLAVGGWGAIRWAWPALVFLIFMVPLPNRFDDFLSAPLQQIATNGAYQILTALGLPAVTEGNVILIHNQRVEVAEACRGLSMLLSFGALITAMVILVEGRDWWERLVLILSIIPIALLCNIIRISITAVAYSYYDRPVKEVHDYAGYGMMALALGIVLAELQAMTWLCPRVEDRDQGPRGPIQAPRGPIKGPR
jgi:exosortase